MRMHTTDNLPKVCTDFKSLIRLVPCLYPIKDSRLLQGISLDTLCWRSDFTLRGSRASYNAKVKVESRGKHGGRTVSGCIPLHSEKFMRQAVYHNVYVLKIFRKIKIWPIHLMDCVNMVQYHNLGSLTSKFEYFGYTRPWISGPNLISSVSPFPKWLFSVWAFSLL